MVPINATLQIGGVCIKFISATTSNALTLCNAGYTLCTLQITSTECSKENESTQKACYNKLKVSLVIPSVLLLCTLGNTITYYMECM